MKNKAAVQDYLLYSAMLFKAIAIFITWYALDRYPGLLCERNSLAGFFLQNDSLPFFVFQLAIFNFVCIGYYMVRREYLMADRRTTTIYSFNVMVGFVFSICLLDAANDTIALLVASSL